jgi:hypothetical protein
MEDKPKERGNLKKAVSRDPRADRLKQALRENLKRRKLQSRGRGELSVGSDGDTPSDDER